MKNKPLDKFHLLPFGKPCDTSRAPELRPDVCRDLREYIAERNAIYRRRQAGLPAPWTSNPVLQQYRFTNVFREYDRETQWLILHITQNAALTYRAKLFNCIMFRLWNKGETMSKLGGPWNDLELFRDPTVYMPHFDRLYDEWVLKEPGYDWFTDAFLTSGLKAANMNLEGRKDGWVQENKVLRMFYVGTRILLSRMLDDISYIGATGDASHVYQLLLDVQGLGPFLAYQVFVDWTYIAQFPFSENEFVVAGPGCQRGLDLLVSNYNGLSYEEVLYWLVDHQDEVFGLDREIAFSERPEGDRRLNVMALENCFCELQKYIRFRATGQGRARRFPGHGQWGDTPVREMPSLFD